MVSFNQVFKPSWIPGFKLWFHFNHNCHQHHEDPFGLMLKRAGNFTVCSAKSTRKLENHGSLASTTASANNSLVQNRSLFHKKWHIIVNVSPELFVVILFLDFLVNQTWSSWRSWQKAWIGRCWCAEEAGKSSPFTPKEFTEHTDITGSHVYFWISVEEDLAKFRTPNFGPVPMSLAYRIEFNSWILFSLFSKII